MNRLLIPILSILFLSCFVTTTHAQLNKPTLYLEAGGSAFAYSLNYDARFLKDTGLGIRVGAAAIQDGNDPVILLPIQLNYIFGKKHGLEIGIGKTIYIEKNFNAFNEKQFEVKHYYIPSIMYRFQGDKGFNFRIGWEPVIGLFEQNDIAIDTFWLWPGASFGYKF